MRNKDGQDYCVCCKAFVVRKTATEKNPSSSPGKSRRSAERSSRLLSADRVRPWVGGWELERVQENTDAGPCASFVSGEAGVLPRGMKVAAEGKLGEESKLEECSAALKRAGEKAAEELRGASHSAAGDSDFFKVRSFDSVCACSLQGSVRGPNYFLRLLGVAQQTGSCASGAALERIHAFQRGRPESGERTSSAVSVAESHRAAFVGESRGGFAVDEGLFKIFRFLAKSRRRRGASVAEQNPTTAASTRL